MRNLKKMLSLVMALAMVASFMVVGASAEFSDVKDIKNTDAVNTLVSLGVIKGYDTGDFKPEGIVTRAEMAKMICVAINGGNDPKLGSTTSKFSDVPATHWASGYIDFCTNMGIIAGYENGTFKPDATVTGVEAAKMLLILIGYDAANSNLTGAQWDINTNAQANLRGFYKDLAINPSQGLTRDSAAQMIYNAVQATMVEYDYKLTTVNGQLTTIPVVIDTKATKNTILKAKFDVTTADAAVLTGVKPVTTGANKGTFNLYFGTTGTAGTVSYTKVAGDYTALLGQSVKVLYKDTDKVYGVYATDDNTVVTTAQSAITDSSGKVKFNDTKYELDSCTTIVDGVANNTSRASTYFVDANSYNNVSFVDNDGDAKYEVAVITTVVPGKVTYVSSTEIIAGGETYKYADENIAEGLVKGDYVTAIYNVAQDKTDIAKIEATKGAVEATKAGPKYQIDGTWYLDDAAMGVSAGDDITVYAVNGVIYAGDKTSSATLSDVVLVTIVAGTIRTEAKYITSDGTVKTVVVDASDKAPAAPTAGKLYTVKEASNGYRFTEVKADIGSYTWQSTKTINTGTIATINSKAIDDGATILVMNKDDGGCKTMTGKQLKTLTATANNSGVNTTALGAFTSKVGGLERITFAAVKMNVNTLPTVGNSKDNYALVLGDSVTVKDGIKYNVWTGSEKVTVVDEDTASVAEGDVIAYSSIDNGTIKDVGVVAPASNTTLADDKTVNVSIQGISGDYLWLNGQTDATHKYEVTKDTVVMYYDSADMAGKAGGEIVLADETDGQYIENAKAVVSTSDKEVLFLLVDVKNKLDDATQYSLTVTKTADRLSAMTVANTDGDTLTAGTDKVKAGDIITVTMTGAATAGEVTVTLTNGVLVGGNTTKDLTVANNGTVKFQVVAGAGDLTIAATNK